jgi:REP element-mobilizing transposase RayT
MSCAIFLTWRLHGTLPFLARHTMPRIPEVAFYAFDRALDTAAIGPKWLEDSTIAQSVVTALKFGESHLGLYHLLAWCVMPNHVHVVLEPLADPCLINQTIRGLVAQNVNQIRGHAKGRFWQDDSYDQWIDGPEDRNRLVQYTEADPVVAGLARAPEDWPWSSASHALTAQSLSVL